MSKPSATIRNDLGENQITDRYGWGWLAMVLAAVAAFYWPFWQGARLEPHSDISNLFAPNHWIAAQALFDGVWPLWNPFHYLGMPFHAGMQGALFYPLNWPLRLLFSGEDALVWALNLSRLSHLFWLAAGGFWMLRRGYGFRAEAAAFGALLIVCCAYTWNHASHLNQVATLAWCPWVIGLARRLALAPNGVKEIRFALLLAATMGLAVLAGHPQNLFYAQLFCAFALPIWLSNLPVTEQDSWARQVGWKLFLFVAAGMIALMLAAIQIVPTAELARQAWIIGEGPEYARSIALPVTKWRELFIPHYFGTDLGGRPIVYTYWMHEEYGVYIGYPALLFFIAGIIAALAHRRKIEQEKGGVNGREVSACVVALFFAILMAVGTATPLYDILLKLFPPLKSFRAPARYLLLAILASLPVIAYGFQFMLGQIETWLKQREKRRLFKFISAFILLLAFTDWYYASARASWRRPFPYFPTAREESLIINKLVQAKEAGDTKRVFWMIQEDEYHNRTASAHWLRARHLAPNNNALLGIEITHGYGESLQPTLRYRDFLYTWHRTFFSPWPDLAFLEAMNVGWIVTNLKPEELKIPKGKLIAREMSEGTRSVSLYKVETELPRIFSSDALRFQGMENIFDGLWQINGEPIGGMNLSFQDYRIHLEETPEKDRDQAAQQAREGISINERGWNELAFSLAEDMDNLYLSQAAYSGWILRDSEGAVRGKLLDQSAILQKLPRELEAGSYTLKFEPQSFKLGALVTGLGLFIWMVGWSALPPRKRRAA